MYVCLNEISFNFIQEKIEIVSTFPPINQKLENLNKGNKFPLYTNLDHPVDFFFISSVKRYVWIYVSLTD